MNSVHRTRSFESGETGFGRGPQKVGVSHRTSFDANRAVRPVVDKLYPRNAVYSVHDLDPRAEEILEMAVLDEQHFASRRDNHIGNPTAAKADEGQYSKPSSAIEGFLRSGDIWLPLSCAAGAIFATSLIAYYLPNISDFISRSDDTAFWVVVITAIVAMSFVAIAIFSGRRFSHSPDSFEDELSDLARSNFKSRTQT